MWYRSELKDRAKDLLRKSYWKCFFVSFLLVIIGGTASSGGSTSNYRISNNSSTGNTIELGNIGLGWVNLIIGIIVIVILIALGLRIFIGFNLEVGARKYYVKASENKDDVNLNYILYGFKNGYWNIVGTMMWKAIAIFLWTLLLIIPGIIKTYAYRMVPYILADNPEIGVSRALELSNDMTRGHKLDMWVLDLSFIGWYLLGLLAFFVGVLFVNPYVDATNAELYLVLRKNSLDDRMCTYGEINMELPIIEEDNDRYRN
jgi:uncharacterized membrane protein